MFGGRFYGLLKVALAAGLWGAAYPLTKGALQSVPPILLGFARFALAAVILAVVARGGPLAGVAPEDRKGMVWLGFWGSFILVLGMNFGLRWAPGTAASIISGTPPLFTVFLAAWLLGEPLKRVHLLAVGAALAGLYLLAGDGDGGGAGGALIWAGYFLVTVPQIAWAVYGVLGKRIIARYPWPVVCRDTFAIGAGMLLPFAVGETVVSGVGNWAWDAVLTLLYLGFFNSVVTYGLWNSALAEIPVSTASFVLYLQPISGAILSALLFGERLGWKGFAGAGLVFLGMGLVLVSGNGPEGGPPGQGEKSISGTA